VEEMGVRRAKEKNRKRKKNKFERDAIECSSCLKHEYMKTRIEDGQEGCLLDGRTGSL
jgi:hypothetical protein